MEGSIQAGRPRGAMAVGQSINETKYHLSYKNSLTDADAETESPMPCDLPKGTEMASRSESQSIEIHGKLFTVFDTRAG